MIISDGRVENSMTAKIERVLNQLEESTYHFYLTGSRFFGQETLTSDYDFFIAHSDDAIQFLFDLGFRSFGAGNYPDSILTDVISYSFEGKKIIDIQILHTGKLRTKKLAQKILAGPLHYEYLQAPKGTYDRIRLWNSLYRVVEVIDEYNNYA